MIKHCHNPYFSRWFSAIRDSNGIKNGNKQSQSLFQQMVFCNTPSGEYISAYILSQSLFQQMVFCNITVQTNFAIFEMSQSLFQQMVFCNHYSRFCVETTPTVSQSLFQQMVFCNIIINITALIQLECHNPYFSRWFSAIKSSHIIILMGQQVTILILVDGFLQWTNITYIDTTLKESQSLFQQMVFCNVIYKQKTFKKEDVTILILVDGFLQQPRKFLKISLFYAKNLYLVTVSVNFTLPNLCI